MKWILVFFGSGIGGCLRLFTSEITGKYFGHTYPFGTFVSNFLACLLLGLVLGFFESTRVLDVRARWLLAVGICGGYSTFSTFSNETLQLLSAQKFAEAFLYVGVSILIGIASVFGGFMVVQYFK